MTKLISWQICALDLNREKMRFISQYVTNVDLWASGFSYDDVCPPTLHMRKVDRMWIELYTFVVIIIK